MVSMVVPYYTKHEITEEDEIAVLRALRSDWIAGNGPECEALEEELAEYTGYKYAVVCNSGTSALMIAGMVMGVCGKKIATTGLTFRATVNALAPKKAFIYPPNKYTFCLSYREKIEIEDVDLIIPVSYAGYPVHRLLSTWGTKSVLFDHAHYLMRGMGNETIYSSIISLHPAKFITGGEGGAFLTHNELYYNTAKSIVSHGYTTNGVGVNYRLSDINAALVRSQLSRIDETHRRRQEIADKYNKAFWSGVNPYFTIQNEVDDHARHIYPILLRGTFGSIDRGRFRNMLFERGIMTQVHYPPLWDFPGIKPILSVKGNEKDWEIIHSIVTIPLYPSMTDEQVDCVINETLEVCEELANE